MEIPAANDKFREAKFLFIQMEKSIETDVFRYFVSAFLSALSTCTEHNRLHSTDARFKGWYEHAEVAYLSNSAILRLKKLRNTELHHKGTKSVLQAEMRFPDAAETTRQKLVFDFSGGKPTGRSKTSHMSEFCEHPVKYGWVWRTKDEPNVMELCSQGLEAVRQLIQSRDDMHFQE